MNEGTARRRWLRYVVELIVVFFGVWLSLMAESWREDRELRRAERVSLARLARDMDADLLDLRSNLARTETGLAAATWLHDRRSPPAPPADSVARQLALAAACSILDVNTSEYVALRSSGRLNNLRDDAFRQEVVSVYEGYGLLDRAHAADCGFVDEALAAVEAEVDIDPAGGAWRIHVTGSPAALLADATFQRALGQARLFRQNLVIIVADRIARLEALQRRALELAGDGA